MSTRSEIQSTNRHLPLAQLETENRDRKKFRRVPTAWEVVGTGGVGLWEDRGSLADDDNGEAR